jgi:uncharacterized protein YndB with AHSA1/START domain
MNHGLTATAATQIAASTSDVWSALTRPDAIRHYMFGTNVRSTWKIGDTITWSGEMNGRKYKDKGEILAIDPERKLSYSHYSPLSGKPDEPESYHTVTIRLSGSEGSTHVTLTQDRNPDAKSRSESEKNWNTMLSGLKRYVEQRA